MTRPAKALFVALALSTTALVPAAALAKAAAPAAVSVPAIPYKSRTLPNGMKVFYAVDRTTPNVTVQVWYSVGSKDDPNGRSGFAHMFEHLMFKATKDLPSESIDRMTEDVGGFNNAFTADDMTAYYEVIPSNHLERMLWAEASRLGSLVVDEASFKSERDVVKEELRQRVLADPYGRFFRLEIPKASYTTHPYKRPGIGSIAELDAATVDDVLAFHETYYRPDNAALIVVGNFDEAQFNGWVDKYFAPLKTPSKPLPRVTVKEPARAGSKTVTAYAPNVPLPALAITWQAPEAASKDTAALSVLDAILSGGKSSRLYNSLVYEQQIAAQAFSNNDGNAQPGLFMVGAIMADGKTVEEGQKALLTQVARLRDAPPTAAELAEAKTEMVAGAVRERETIDGRAMALGQAYVLEGDVAKANTVVADLEAVTAADVQRVARTYLGEDRMVVIRYLDESRKTADAPAAAEAPPPVVASTKFAGKVWTLDPEDRRAKPPALGAPVTPVLPKPSETTLPNGLRVIVARSSQLPLVSAQLNVLAGAATDPDGKAGAASMMAELLTEGTATRSATQIASQTEALGANLSAGSGVEASSVTLNVMPQNLKASLAIMADVALHPAFAQEEIDRVRDQSLDGLKVAMKRPGAVAGLVSAPVLYAGTPYGRPANGTPESLPKLTRDDLAAVHKAWWRPDNAVLVITGDISPDQGFALAREAFGGWAKPATPLPAAPKADAIAAPRNVVVDIPSAGQAAVIVTRRGIKRDDSRYYAGMVATTTLGIGFSSRLNQEIRIKRGLAYGAGAGLTPRRVVGGFTATTQTKNESVPEVATLIREEMKGMATRPATSAELAARKSVLIGDFGRDIGTADGLAGILGGLATYRIDLGELQAYTGKVEAVTAQDITAFSADIFDPSKASTIVVGDAKLFGAKAAEALPNAETIKIDDLKLDSPTLK
ncbi:M16 family metallopeptidase [Caulobacter mirabilis]|uniref:Peptidase M16 n=1 Tax=Caulobacter mirabilis TaxID=69666 RepID=A0A2D2ASL5_9CAUL|nr:pitrilysin family protein [Caulobacter mirabilis]ATQ41008.1 peptidase M16 [Caulobacter mirabilis]